MRIAFVGKGGSGKTTISSLFCRYLASLGKPVLAIDADINQHLGEALGITKFQGKPLADALPEIKAYLRNTNARIRTSQTMIKTTPPGRGSRLLSLSKFETPITECIDRSPEGILFMRTGEFHEHDIGVKCYHAKTGAAELILSHLIDQPNETVVVDMTAGADAFASGLFIKFDLTCLIVEPTKKSVDVFRQYEAYGEEYGIRVEAVANKITGENDLHYIETAIGRPVIASLGNSEEIRNFEQTGELPNPLSPSIEPTLRAIQASAHNIKRDWKAFQYNTELFHTKNAISWGNAAIGEDLTGQVDPEFRLADAV